MSDLKQLNKNINKEFAVVMFINESKDDVEISLKSDNFLRRHIWGRKTDSFDVGSGQQQRIQLDDDGHSFSLKIKRNGEVSKEYIIKTLQQIRVTQDGSPQQESSKNELANIDQKQLRDAFITQMKLNDYYKVLQVTRTATQEDLRKAYRRLMRQYHPDRNESTLESTIITQRITEAYKFLSDNTNRDMYNSLVDHQRGFFSLSRWRSFFANHSRWPYLVLTASFFVCGGAALIGLAFLAAPVVAVFGGIAAAAFLSAGQAGTLHVLSLDTALNGVEYKKLFKVMGVHGVACAAVGLCSAGIGAVVPGVVSSIIPNASRMAVSVISGAVSGGTTGVVGGMGSVFAGALAEDRWKDKTARECVVDALKGAVSGALLGAVGGAVVGAWAGRAGSSGGGVANTGADEAVGNAAGVGQNAGRAVAARVQRAIAPQPLDAPREIVQMTNDGIEITNEVTNVANVSEIGQDAGRAAMSRLRRAMASPAFKACKTAVPPTFKVCEKIISPIVEAATSEIDLLIGRAPATNCNANTNSPEKTDSNTEENASHNYMTFYNKTSGVVAKMELVYLINRKKERQTVKDNQTVSLPPDAKKIIVWFEVLRFIGCYCKVKQWDRRNDKWNSPKQAEIFKYSSPPQRSFTLEGSLHYEAITQVRDEREYLIFDECVGGKLRLYYRGR